LFSRGQRPAIDIGLSVTRSGKQTQTHLEQELSNTLSTYLAQYNKTRGLIHFGAELNEKTRALLLKGETLWEFLKQPKDWTYPKAVQVIMSAAIYLDAFQAVPPSSIPQARDNLTLAYQKQPEVQKVFNKMLSAPNFADFQLAVTNYKQELLQLCKL
jgi:F-type H+-transporting ATPase subunit alpha